MRIFSGKRMLLRFIFGVGVVLTMATAFCIFVFLLKLSLEASHGDVMKNNSSSAETKPSDLPETFTLTDDPTNYFVEMVPGLSCFLEGTDFKKTSEMLIRQDNAACSCLPGYFGKDCGIPETIWISCSDDICQRRLVQRKTPRRLIHGINVNHELEFFEARISEIGDVVDVLIVGESNLTAGGDPSEFYLLPELEKGLMKDYQHKTIHVPITEFPPQGLVDGWFADTFIRDFMGKEGLRRIRNIRDDDLFLLLDADEIPERQILLFFKLYDGYPEPVALTLRWSVFGFFWKQRKNEFHWQEREDYTRVVALCTMRMIREVYDGNVMSLRRNYVERDPIHSRIQKYLEGGNFVRHWSIGTVGHYAGFHCSWCYLPDKIRLKLESAQKDDKPRWGDYPEKLDLGYIASLIKQGQWFDGSYPFLLIKPEDDPQYAPNFFLRNWKRFEYLLRPPIKQRVIKNTQ